MLNSQSPATRKVSLLFTSDEHGYVSRQSKLQGEVLKTRQDNPQGTLLISCGDVFEGSAETGVLGLDASKEMLRTAGYNGMTLGNHDFDRGSAVTRQWVKDAPCPVLVSNVRDTETGELLEGTIPSQVFELNGVKVGLVGVTTPETEVILPKTKLEGLDIEDPTVAVKAEVARLQSQGIQVIGLLSHLGLPADREIAKAIPELDFILGGHTHDFLESPEKVGQTVIAHSGCFRQAIGHLELDIDTQTGEVQKADYKLVKGQGQAEDTGEVGALASDVEHKVAAAMGTVIGHLSKPVDYDPNELGDGMEYHFAKAVREKTGADVVLINQKGMRSGLPGGDVKLGDVFNVFPFDNRVVTTRMKASQAMSIYNESFRRADQTMLTVSDYGVVPSMDVATHQPQLVERRLDTVGTKIVDGVTILADPIVVDGDQELTVATLDFLLQGGLNYFEANKQPITEDYGTARSVLESYVIEKFAS